MAVAGVWWVAAGRRLEYECWQLDVAVMLLLLQTVFPHLLPSQLWQAHRSQRGFCQVSYLGGLNWPRYSVLLIYRGCVYHGIGYITVACWTHFLAPWYFLQNHSNSLEPIYGRQFLAKSAHRDSLCSRFAGDNFRKVNSSPPVNAG